MAGRPGKTAPRLLQDLSTYDPRFEDRAKRNLLTSHPPLHDPSADRTAAVPYKNCRHTFQNKPEQSLLPQPDEPCDNSTVYKIASYCHHCRWHFDILVDLDDMLRYKPCQKSNAEYPLHHFLFEGEEAEYEPAIDGSQVDPRTFKFDCSAPDCPAQLRIRVTPPILSQTDIQTLTDRAILRQRFETAKQVAGERADSTMARSVDALDFLNTYLIDSLNPRKGKTHIPLLNRKFLKTFGRDCDSILKKLGFTSFVETDVDGVTTEGWHLPKPRPAEDPSASLDWTERTVIENTRCELNAIIVGLPDADKTAIRHVPVSTTPSHIYIERALGCADYDKVKGRTETRSVNHEEDHPYYAGLGTVGDFADHLLLFAYERQVACDSAHGPYYFECLQDLALGRKSENLQENVAIAASNGAFSRRDIASAYRYFGIDPAHSGIISDEHIVGVFRSRLSDISPSMADETRKQLKTIGVARNSTRLQQEAFDSIETYEQALSWLGLDKEQPDDFVSTMFSIKVADSPSSTDTARKAVRIIAEHRHSQRLMDLLDKGIMGEAEMGVAEAYAILNINDRATSLDKQVLEEMVNMQIEANPELESRYKEALAKVQQDQETMYGSRTQPQIDYPLETWPVGCSNIGNTCYLNSVLQFLFTIKPLRKLVLNCEANMQELTPEALELKRVGRTAVSLARAETGQQFVRELRKLFQHMIDAPTPSIRPERTLAALALTRGEGLEVTEINSTTSTSLGVIGGLPISGPALPPKAVAGSRPPTPADSVIGNDANAKSDTDSMKAMDLTVPDLVDPETERPEPPSRPPPVPPRPQSSADTGFKKIEDVARQQDAAEILNNVFDLMSCAFKGEASLRDREQDDMIKQLFFSDVTTVRVNKGKDASKSDLQDNIHVSTKDRDRTLCAALDDEFGLTELEDGVTKYELFEKAAPIQIINVRRLQFENNRARKDESHLALDKVLFLDRYLKKTSSLTEDALEELRNQQWQLQTELRRLDGRRKAIKETDFQKLDLPDVLEETAQFANNIRTELPQYISAASELAPEELSSELNQRAGELKPEVQQIHDRMERLEEEIDAVFENCKDHPYRLHAIFIHAGSHSGGHYWIYVYDFQNDMWRSYNDETVKLETEEDVLKKIVRVHPPTSTGIVYVREDVADEYTEAVFRMPNATSDMNGHHDVEMKDADLGGAAPKAVATGDEWKGLQVINGVSMEHASPTLPPLRASKGCDSPDVELVEDTISPSSDERVGIMSAELVRKRSSSLSMGRPESPGKRSRAWSPFLSRNRDRNKARAARDGEGSSSDPVVVD